VARRAALAAEGAKRMQANICTGCSSGLAKPRARDLDLRRWRLRQHGPVVVRPSTSGQCQKYDSEFHNPEPHRTTLLLSTTFSRSLCLVPRPPAQTCSSSTDRVWPGERRLRQKVQREFKRAHTRGVRQVWLSHAQGIFELGLAQAGPRYTLASTVNCTREIAIGIAKAERHRERRRE